MCERAVQKRSEAAEIRRGEWARNISKYEVAGWEVKVKRMIMGISSEEMEAWARSICFSADVRSDHFFQIGIRTRMRERILGVWNQPRKP